MELVALLSTGKGSWVQIAGLIEQGEWDSIILIGDDYARKFMPNKPSTFIYANLEQPIKELRDDFAEKLKDKRKLRQGIPVLRDLRTEIIRIARGKLEEADANRVEKALRPDVAAPFGLDDLHSFVHQAKDLPGGRDILQFWTRTEPLFRMMLEQHIDGDAK